MESGSNTLTTSGKEKVFRFRSKTAYVGDWLSWKFHDKREYGKAFRSQHPKAEIHVGHWTREEFEWAVAEGRVPLESIVLLEDYLTRFEMKYIWAQAKFK
jgi:hypothetical protein